MTAFQKAFGGAAGVWSALVFFGIVGTGLIGGVGAAFAALGVAIAAYALAVVDAGRR